MCQIANRELYPESAEGCWFDSARGIYIGEAVQEEAQSKGWDGQYENPDSEYYTEAWTEAEDFLSNLAPDGYWIGSTENGDFGMWKIEEDSDD